MRYQRTGNLIMNSVRVSKTSDCTLWIIRDLIDSSRFLIINLVSGSFTFQLNICPRVRSQQLVADVSIRELRRIYGGACQWEEKDFHCLLYSTAPRIREKDVTTRKVVFFAIKHILNVGWCSLSGRAARICGTEFNKHEISSIRIFYEH